MKEIQSFGWSIIIAGCETGLPDTDLYFLHQAR